MNNRVPMLKDYNLVLFNDPIELIIQKYGYEWFKAKLSTEDLATQYLAYIKSVQPYGPYNLFGWSFGGNLTFEIARQLIQVDNEIISNLFMLDSWFYHLDTEDSEKFDGYMNLLRKYKPSTIFSTFSAVNVVLFKAKNDDEKCISEYTSCRQNYLIIYLNQKFIKVNDRDTIVS
jgi:hypothetical protein